MGPHNLQLPNHHQKFVDRFSAVCQADERVLAAFLGGSYGKGRADAFSDLDLTLITTDATYEQFAAGREAFVRNLGEPLFIEDFDLPNIVFLIFSDGTEAEIWFAGESHLEHIRSGPFHILLDKTGILTSAEFPSSAPGPAGQTEKLRRLIYWFWHDLSHFITAVGRGQLWWAHGQLDVLRGICVNLLRLRHNFSDEGAGEEPYFKLEDTVSPEDLSVLQDTFCPMEQGSILRSARVPAMEDKTSTTARFGPAPLTAAIAWLRATLSAVVSINDRPSLPFSSAPRTVSWALGDRSMIRRRRSAMTRSRSTPRSRSSARTNSAD